MTLRVVELFSGIGAQRMALMQAGIDHEVVAISEINKHSLASYEAIYGDCPNLGDISKVERLPPCDLVTYSFPCFVGSTPVRTPKGDIPIKDIRRGDLVATDDGWHRVLAQAMTGIHPVIGVLLADGRSVGCTPDHRFMAWAKGFVKPDWIPARMLTREHLCKVWLDGLGWTWMPVESVSEPGDPVEVYDIEVESAHCFLANGILAHNCVDLSLAGKRAGMGEGTRSGLVWEVVRLLESAGERERPEWLLMENVPQVLTSPLWPDLVKRLESMGYRNTWAKLDSSRFGSAQKRVRAFMLSRLGRFPPELPESTDAPPKCIRDIMEEEVEERFIRRIPLERIKWREPIKGYHHPQSDGIDCPLLDASDPRLETRRIASEESLCPTLRTGVSVRVVSEEEEERAKALCEKADNVRLAPKGEKSIGTTSEGGTRLVVSPEEQRRKAGIDRDAELVEEHFRMAKGPGDRVRHEDDFEEGSSRKEGGLYSVQKEDGHVRFYRGNQAKAGLSEAQYYPADSQSPAVTSSHPPKVLDVEGGIGVLADIKKGGRMQNNRLHDPLGQSPALRTHGGGDHDIKVVQGIEAYDPDADIHVFGCRDDEGNIDQNADPTVAFRNRRVYLDDGKAPACVVHTTKIPVVDGIEPSSTPVAEDTDRNRIADSEATPLDEIHVVGDDKEDSYEWRARIYGKDGKAPAITDLGRRGKEFLKVADSVEPSSTPVAGIEGETYYPAKMLYSKDNLAPTLATSHSLSRGVKVVDKIEPSSTPVASIEGETYYPKAMLYSSSSSSPTVTPGGRHGKNCCIKVIDGVEQSSTPVAENMDESFYSGRMLYSSSSSSSPTVRTFHGRSCQIKVIDGIETTSGEDDSCDPTDTRGDRTELVPRMEEGDVCPMLTPGRRVKRQNGQRYREPNPPAFTVTCQDHNGCAYPKDGDLIVRVLTPLECWRLMGFPDWAYERASKVSSETQLYNQAGNSIVVEVLEAIFRTMVEPPKAEQSMLTRWLRWMPPQS